MQRRNFFKSECRSDIRSARYYADYAGGDGAAHHPYHRANNIRTTCPRADTLLITKEDSPRDYTTNQNNFCREAKSRGRSPVKESVQPLMDTNDCGIQLPPNGVEQVLQLFLDVGRTGHRLRNLHANEFAITLAQPMHLYRHRIDGHLQARRHRVVGAIARKS